MWLIKLMLLPFKCLSLRQLICLFFSPDHKTAVENTVIPMHLEKMLIILFEEEKVHEGMSGPCMEYLLQHKILETLYTLARSDVRIHNFLPFLYILIVSYLKCYLPPYRAQLVK